MENYTINARIKNKEMGQLNETVDGSTGVNS